METNSNDDTIWVPLNVRGQLITLPKSTFINAPQLQNMLEPEKLNQDGTYHVNCDPLTFEEVIAVIETGHQRQPTLINQEYLKFMLTRFGVPYKFPGEEDAERANQASLQETEKQMQYMKEFELALQKHIRDWVLTSKTSATLRIVSTPGFRMHRDSNVLICYAGSCGSMLRNIFSDLTDISGDTYIRTLESNDKLMIKIYPFNHKNTKEDIIISLKFSNV